MAGSARSRAVIAVAQAPTGLRRVCGPAAPRPPPRRGRSPAAFFFREPYARRRPHSVSQRPRVAAGARPSHAAVAAPELGAVSRADSIYQAGAGPDAPFDSERASASTRPGAGPAGGRGRGCVGAGVGSSGEGQRAG